MPVQFRETVQYGSRYSPNAVRYRTSDPAPYAGIPSTSLGMTEEPALQKKKRMTVMPESQAAEEPSLQTKKRPNALPEHREGPAMEPPLQRRKKPLSASHPNPSDDYMLLGNHEKFASNVRYQPKPARTVGGGGEPALPTPSTPPPAPRLLAPAPKVVVDTGAPVKHQSPAAKSVSTSTQDRVVNGYQPKNREQPPKKPHIGNTGLKLTNGPAPKLSDGPAPKPSNGPTLKLSNDPATKLLNGPAPKLSTASPPKAFPTQAPKKSEKVPQKSVIDKEGNRRPTDALKTQAAQKKVDHMAGPTADQQKAKADYALQYQVGVAPRRPHPPTRLSEYQIKYRWLQGEPAAPLIAADQVVHKSQAAIPSLKGAPRLSEYRRQFQDYKYSPVDTTEDKQTKLKRSKSLSALGGRKMPAAGTAKVTTPEDRRLLQESVNPLKFHFPHGKYKRQSSEYAANYINPTSVSYVEGAWRGVSPPQINSQQAVQLDLDDEPAGESPPVGSWFSEVLELRKKADEYKTRARGTHFSRAHLAQLYHAQNADLWDSHSTLSALSLEAPPSVRSASVKVGSVQEAWLDKAPPTLEIPEQSEASYSARSVDEASQPHSGRVTMPEIRSTSEKLVRHHLDRTTPNVGGAILTSPAHTANEHDNDADSYAEPVAKQQETAGTKPQVGRHRQDCSCATQTGGDQSEQATQIDSARLMKAMKRSKKLESKRQTEKKNVEKIIEGDVVVNGMVKIPDERRSSGSKVMNVGQVTAAPQQAVLQSAPTFGMPTRDTHVLVDENAPIDRPLKATYIQAPQVEQVPWSDQDGVPDHDVRNKPPLDDDVASVCSFASSCSMASQVLERARQRRDEFWDKNGHVRQ